ncbi:MAG: hypothetical protein JRH20_10570 [Deltaproteobacteria bacterium]|nr:hypothetical protein [Deltaproteobacteria bacterium]
MLRPLLLILLFGFLLPSSVWADDALDKVTGTEGWREGASSDPRTEWRDWLHARNAWRAALRSLRIEAARNRQLAALRRKRDKARAFRKTARPKSFDRGSPAAKPQHRIRIYRGTADEDEDDEEDEVDEDAEGSKVPLERLHNTRDRR